jgi:hypothetical protein
MRPVAADDPVAVADGGRRAADGERRAEGDVDAGLGPEAGDGVGVDLGAPGLVVVQVAPGEEVDAAQARSGCDLAERPRRVVGRSHSGAVQYRGLEAHR